MNFLITSHAGVMLCSKDFSQTGGKRSSFNKSYVLTAPQSYWITWTKLLTTEVSPSALTAPVSSQLCNLPKCSPNQENETLPLLPQQNEPKT